MKHLLLIGAAFAVLSSPAMAAPCRGPNGKFISCARVPAKAAAPTRCKGANGRFVKCGTPGAHPA